MDKSCAGAFSLQAMTPDNFFFLFSYLPLAFDTPTPKYKAAAKQNPVTIECSITTRFKPVIFTKLPAGLESFPLCLNLVLVGTASLYQGHLLTFLFRSILPASTESSLGEYGYQWLVNLVQRYYFSKFLQPPPVVSIILFVDIQAVTH